MGKPPQGQLADIAEIVMGQSPEGEACNTVGNGMPLLNGPTEFGGHHPTPAQYTSDARKLAAKGDILFCVRGSTTGKMNWADRPYAIGRGLAAIRPKHGVDTAHYVRAVIEAGLSQLLQAATGSTFPNVSREQLLGMPCHVLGVSEQKRISGILGALDDKIELNRKMNETLEQMAQALFKSWFVDFDPVHAKAAGRQPAGMDKATADLFPDSFVDSELGKIPKGWRIGTISEIATNPKRGIQPGDIAPGTPYIGLEHMPRRSIALGDWADSNVVESGKTVFKKGEVLFGKLRPYFHKVGLAQVDGVCSTDILVLSPISENWRGSLLCIASSDELIQFTNLASTGTKMPRTNWRDVGSFKIVMPCNGVAEEFTKQTTSLTDKIGQNLAESKILTETRDVLLPKLLSRR